jgi:uncharacterized pyridoxamine 5'-phosphate oxidase family protein
MIQAVTDFLNKSQVHYFATIGTDNKPKVRPFQFMFEEAGKLYFCTSNQKMVFKEIQNNPHVEISSSLEDFSWLRLNGKVVFSDDLTLKQKVLDLSPIVQSIYNTADNPAFELFYLDKAHETIADFSGKPPQVIDL